MKTKKRKIRLQKETLLGLSSERLEEVNGAAPATWSVCPTISCMSCEAGTC
jgi:hypothetical protein